MTSALRPQKTAMLVAQRIVADINRRGNTVGDHLPPERVMLEEYEVGRGTLRESLRFLELQGVISLKPGPGGGPVVRQPDGSGVATALTLLLQFENAPLRMIAEARTGLEPLMARLAAERMSEPELRALRSSVDAMYDALGDQTAFLKQNKRFHDIVAHGSGNALLGHLTDTLLSILDDSVVGIDYPEARRSVVHQAHQGIYEAIAAHDPDASFEAMFQHVRDYVHYAEHAFPDLLASPVVWNASR